MKKVLLFILGTVSLIVLLVHIGPMIGLLISLAILYFAFKKFTRAATAGSKFLWALIGLIAAGFSIGNIPSLIGLIALAGLYYAVHTWKNSTNDTAGPSDDPFDHFEKEWKELH
ncbi:MAG: flagellar basal body rod protein [Sporolactobacillus sp.]